jgi:hypothetical protein
MASTGIADIIDWIEPLMVVEFAAVVLKNPTRLPELVCGAAVWDGDFSDQELFYSDLF